MYAVHLAPKAEIFLKTRPHNVRARLEERLKRLSTMPYPSDAKFITRDEGHKVYRYRIGDYRALYTVYEDQQAVLIHAIDKRSKIYH